MVDFFCDEKKTKYCLRNWSDYSRSLEQRRSLTFYDAINYRKLERATIPPWRRAQIWQHGNRHKERLIRDENLRAIRQKGRAQWKRESNYHRRSLAETAVFRYKRIFTDRLQSRKKENQFQEMAVNCAALNRMTHFGMPESYKVTN